MKTAHRLIVLAAVLAVAASAHAQSEPSKAAPVVKSATTVGEVVVKGQMEEGLARNIPESVWKKLPDIVWKDAPARARFSHTGTLSRWIDPVCPGTIGLTHEYALFVSRRINDVARQFVKVRRKCGSGINVVVAFTGEPQKMLTDVLHNQSGLFGYHYTQEDEQLATSAGPIQAWYVTATNDDIDDPYKDAKAYRAAGRYKANTVSSIRFVLVVVDGDLIEGQPIGRTADHVVALVLSNTAFRKGCSPLPSILDSLNPACPQSASLQSLTDYDWAILKGLYSTDPQEREAAARGSLMSKVVTVLHQEAAGAGGRGALEADPK